MASKFHWYSRGICIICINIVFLLFIMCNDYECFWNLKLYGSKTFHVLDVKCVFFLRETHSVTEHSIIMGGHRIHGLLLSTFEVHVAYFEMICLGCLWVGRHGQVRCHLYCMLYTVSVRIFGLLILLLCYINCLGRRFWIEQLLFEVLALINDLL